MWPAGQAPALAKFLCDIVMRYGFTDHIDSRFLMKGIANNMMIPFVDVNEI
jgi:hypothetical protein